MLLIRCFSCVSILHSTINIFQDHTCKKKTYKFQFYIVQLIFAPAEFPNSAKSVSILHSTINILTVLILQQ
mgnify:CR=1 FL=1